VLTLTGLMDTPASYGSPNQETRLHVSVMVGEIPCNVSNVAQFPKRYLKILLDIIAFKGTPLKIFFSRLMLDI
jgi:hypothetical protein